jgi:hypothetical protein
MGEPQSRSGRGGEEKNSDPLSELEPPIIQPVVQHYTTELSRLLYAHISTQNSSVGTALSYGLDDRGSIPCGFSEFFSSPPRPERLWGPPSLLANGYQGLFPWGYSSRGVKLTTHLHLVPRSKNEWSYTSTPPILLHGVVLS